MSSRRTKTGFGVKFEHTLQIQLKNDNTLKFGNDTIRCNNEGKIDSDGECDDTYPIIPSPILPKLLSMKGSLRLSLLSS